MIGIGPALTTCRHCGRDLRAFVDPDRGWRLVWATFDHHDQFSLWNVTCEPRIGPALDKPFRTGDVLDFSHEPPDHLTLAEELRLQGPRERLRLVTTIYRAALWIDPGNGRLSHEGEDDLPAGTIVTETGDVTAHGEQWYQTEDGYLVLFAPDIAADVIVTESAYREISTDHHEAV